jgi:hypothetical protein
MTKKNKQIVLAYVDAFNRGDIDALCALFAPDALIYGAFGWGCVAKARPIWQALADTCGMNLQVDSIISESNVVAVRYTEREKSVRPFYSDQVNDCTYEMVAMEWFELKDGFINRRWCARDSASICQQRSIMTTDRRLDG